MNVAGAVIGRSKRLAKTVLRGFIGHPARTRAAVPEYWGLTRTASGDLALQGISLHQAGQTWGFPLHVVNAARLRDNARRFLAVPPGHQRGCEVFYSYKTNPVPGVLRELHAAGLGAEVISHYELWLARRMGVPPSRIVFNGPAKSDAAIAEAVVAGIELLNVNHREELPRVAAIADRLGRRQRVGIRVTVAQGWSGQFGVPVTGGAALRAYEEARRLPGIEVVGLHAHRGGMIRSREELASFADAVLDFVDDLYLRTGLTLDVLDFGGSLATPTVQGLSTYDVRMNRTLHRNLTAPDPARCLGIEDYVAELSRRVQEFFTERRRPAPRVFIEPGRAITGDAQMLVTSVLTIKQDVAGNFLVLDAGINLAESCRSEYHQLLPALNVDRPANTVYTVVGPICTPGDTLYWAARLPALQPGESVAIMDAGAYFVPFATSFSFPQPPIVMVSEGKMTRLRRGEQFEDLVQLDDLAPPGEGPFRPGADR
jgi:diaminopimelate decarboxylase